MKLYKSFIIIILFTGCTTVPITNRKQVKLLPTSQLGSLSLDQYTTFKKDNNILSESNLQVQKVRKVGEEISSAVELFLIKNGMKKRVDEFNWEFNVAQENTLNAWCMPGGRVMFYTGILEVCQDEQGIAVVMGHEIAHAVARHGNERMSQSLIVEGGGVALSVLTQEQPEMAKNLFFSAYGIGSQLGTLKYSRIHESEADKMGLVFMIMAGYNPNEAIEFWSRMSSLKNGNKPPEFLSTHPNDETRIRDLKEFIPEANNLAQNYLTKKATP